jgi:nucleotide-binding universal stress UspA family protein
MNSFLVHIPTEREIGPLIDASISLARSFGARLDAIAVGYETTSIGLAVEGGTAVAAIFEIERERAMAKAKAALSIIEVETKNSGIACNCISMTATPYDATEAVCARARLYDLTIALQPDPDVETFDNTLPLEILFGAGGPVFLVPYTHKGPIKLDNVGIAWDGSRLAARALRDASPFLAGAKKVSLITANNAGHSDASAEALKAHLARRRLNVSIAHTSTAPADIQPAILSIAADEDIDLLVMGGYGHSRLRERILGGVTRGMLQSMTIPTLMSH